MLSGIGYFPSTSVNPYSSASTAAVGNFPDPFITLLSDAGPGTTLPTNRGDSELLKSKFFADLIALSVLTSPGSQQHKCSTLLSCPLLRLRT